jgi:hypothetical protein
MSFSAENVAGMRDYYVTVESVPPKGNVPLPVRRIVPNSQERMLSELRPKNKMYRYVKGHNLA